MAAKKQLSPQEKMIAQSKAREAKKQRFIKLANARMTRALKAIDQVRRLSNRQSYHYDAPHVSRISQALKDAVENTVKAFTASAVEKKEEGFQVD